MEMFARHFPLLLIVLITNCCVISGLDFRYHQNDELEGILTDFVNRTSLPLVSELYSIGKTHAGNQIWVLKLSAANESSIGTPNIKLIGNMHGNEAVGREVLLHFIEHLLINYNKDKTVTWLLNNTNIHVLPSLNPDGFRYSHNDCEDMFDRGRNVPHLKVDLNRNFPSYFHDNSNVRVNNTAESNAIMRWMENNTFILSAALHGGEMVVNYPFDIRKEVRYDKGPSYTADNDVFVHLAKAYAKNHPKMKRGQPCSGNETQYEEGIVNGAEWYETDGSMGDYNYAFHGCMELTLEISCCKYPPQNQLPAFWEENREALLQYCMQAHMGVTGQILDFDTGFPIKNANLSIIGRNMQFWSTKNTGEFWRILVPGRYKIKVEVKGYHTKIESFEVADNKAKYPKLTFLRIVLQNSSVYTTTEQINTETITTHEITIHEETTRAITKTSARVSPKFNNRHGSVDEEIKENLAAVKTMPSGSNNMIFTYIILFFNLLFGILLCM